MPSNLRQRKLPLDLPRSTQNPKPSSPDSPSHVSFNRQRPTIAPTVFLVLIISLTVSLLPVFYYTQVMVPDPESKSIWANFRIKGNILLSALGHTSSSGHGRIPYVEDPSIVSNVGKSEPKSAPKPSAQAQNLADDPRFKQVLADLKDSKPEKQIKASDGPLLTDEQKLEEDLGRFWKASSEYRREAQKTKAGQYAMQGDGTSVETIADEYSIDDLPEADPDAKEGLTPEVWEAIKEKFSADDLTVMLDQMRRKEQASQAAAT